MSTVLVVAVLIAVLTALAVFNPVVALIAIGFSALSSALATLIYR